MSTRTPAGVSWMCTRIVSPGFIIRSTDGSGLSAFATPSSSRSRDVESAFAGACDLPLRVTYAQFSGSMPASGKLSQSALFVWPVF